MHYLKFVGSLRGGVTQVSGEASSFGWFLGRFRWFLLVAVDIAWLQVVYYFSSYTNFTTYRRVISLLYSWTQVIDWIEIILFFYSKEDSKKKIIIVLSPSRLKVNIYFQYLLCYFLYYYFLYSILCQIKKLLLKISFLKAAPKH